MERRCRRRPRSRYFRLVRLVDLRPATARCSYDPFFPPYCGAEWFHLQGFHHARYICLTHGHEDISLDVPVVAHATGATVILTLGLLLPENGGVAFRRTGARHRPPRLRPIRSRFTRSLQNGNIATINLYKAMTKAVVPHGNATQLSWAWTRATARRSIRPTNGFPTWPLPDGSNGKNPPPNYKRGLQPTLMDRRRDRRARAALPQPNVLLAAWQPHFVDDIVRGVRR